MHITDVHCHIYPDKIAAKAVRGIGDFYDLPMSCDGTFDDAVARHDRAGVDRGIIFSVATTVHQVRSINEFIAGTVKISGGRYIGFGTLHPESPTLTEDIDHIIELGLRGVKLHPDVQQFRLDDYRCLKIYEYCEGKLPLLVHAGDFRYDYSNTNRLIPILDIYEGLTVIAAHLGGWSLWEESSERLAGYKNLYVDCSSSLYSLSPEEATSIIKRYGADKVLFGTDFPMWDASEELERFDKLDLTQEERELILWKNADRLFGLY